jgi:hypothetical protein
MKRKTPQMALLETKYELAYGSKVRIDELILDYIHQNKGSVRNAGIQISRELMNVSESTLSRWVFSLDLAKSINRIKREFGNKKILEEDSDDALIIFQERLQGRCTVHQESFKELSAPLSMIKIIPTEENSLIIIKDNQNVNHSFLVESQELSVVQG